MTLGPEDIWDTIPYHPKPYTSFEAPNPRLDPSFLVLEHLYHGVGLDHESPRQLTDEKKEVV